MSFLRSSNRVKSIKIKFCDWGGSSTGIRELLKQQEFYNLVNKNEKTHFNFSIKRNQHPIISAEFVNGYKKQITVKNENPDKIYETMKNIFNESKLISYYFKLEENL